MTISRLYVIMLILNAGIPAGIACDENLLNLVLCKEHWTVTERFNTFYTPFSVQLTLVIKSKLKFRFSSIERHCIVNSTLQ